MIKAYLKIIFFICCFQVLHSQTVVDVNPGLFLEDGTNVVITTVSCTLSDGSMTTCFEITTNGTPTDHAQGPWCPDNISDGADAGGIWLEGGEVYDVDGAFIENMATFYNDDNWLMYDSNGDIYTTDTETDCANAANPEVGAEYENFCVECLPSYLGDLKQTFLIPVTPVSVNNPFSFGGDGGGPGGGGPGGPGGGGEEGPTVRGLAFNGVRFDAPAPTNAILSAYTIAPFDDAGGHINLNAGYHYHAATGVSTEFGQCDGHAPMIGYALDGHAIYSQVNEDGNEPTDLDECRGHYDDLRGYHYHVDAAGNNNFINCLSGAYVADSGATVSIDSDGDGYFLGNDCDDNDSAINPGVTEIPNNGIDENCDGSDLCDCIDLDMDGVCVDDDCDDTNADISPNSSEITYNGIDDDCNVATLDDDLDQDGYNLTDDCDDTNAAINPNAVDIPDNGIDENCDGVDATNLVDADGDGFFSDEDCDDNNASVNPDQTEVPYNGIDDDCNTETLDNDLDQDGFNLADDCDDNNPGINPNAIDIPDNDIDENCDGVDATTVVDADGDGFFSDEDCDDNNPSVNPGQTEEPYNGLDDDCNTATLDDDLDQDGFNLADDCDDTNAAINPNASDIPNNGIDENCDGVDATTVVDSDGDGYFSDEDCNDNNPNINPGASETCDGIDENCNGDIDEGLTELIYYEDMDGDGYGNTSTSLLDCRQPTGYSIEQGDCDDNNPSINPNQTEVPYNDIDEDCNSATLDDDLDQDGFNLADDCDDNNPNINPDVEDIPNNGIDENCDGLDATTAVHELANSTINIYPNPARTVINIAVDGQLNFETRLYDFNGKLIMTNTNSDLIHIESVPTGVYLLEIRNLETGQKIIERVTIDN